MFIVTAMTLGTMFPIILNLKWLTAKRSTWGFKLIVLMTIKKYISLCKKATFLYYENTIPRLLRIFRYWLVHFLFMPQYVLAHLECSSLFKYMHTIRLGSVMQKFSAGESITYTFFWQKNVIQICHCCWQRIVSFVHVQPSGYSMVCYKNRKPCMVWL